MIFIKIILTIIFFFLWISTGLFLKYRKPQKNKIKTKHLKNENPILISNFLGNVILFQTLTIILYTAYGYKSSSPFLCGSFMMGLALIFHIRDITGKPIDVIFNKLEFSGENLKNSFFMRISLFVAIIFFIFSIIIPLFFKYK